MGFTPGDQMSAVSPGRSGSGARAAAAADVAGGAGHVVHEAVLQRLLGGEPAVAGVGLLDRLDRLAGVRGDELRHLPLDVKDLLGLDLDVGGRAAAAAARLG